MEILLQIAIFSVSLFALAKASDIVVKSSMKLAKLIRIEELVIGFLFIATITSIPELAVSFSAISAGNAEICIGNLFGSNIANLSLILGILSLIKTIKIGRRIYHRLLTALFLSSLIPLFLFSIAKLSFIVGLFLILVFISSSLYTAKKKLVWKIPPLHKTLLEKLSKSFELYRSLFLLSASLFIVIISSRFVVTSAESVAKMLKVPYSLLGATLIAIGTSLPELSICWLALKRKRFGLITGNLIGSCLTNLTLILGITLFFSPFAIDFQIFSTLLVFAVAATIISWYFLLTGRKLSRNEGLMLLFFYIIFLISISGVQLIF